LYKAMVAFREAGHSDIRQNAYAAEFFDVEYRVDYLIHTYTKPILCWGHGIVMGGGIGLMSGASHRVVSERSKLAFPEITVGLFPDVGGSWLLPRVPGNGGLFLALTGALLNPGDAIYAGLADVHVAEERRSAVFDALLQ
ncbi:enoyl-CoA hydratase/isomerase family protein, partial [Corallococcus carmarthensis]|nr:enoyl-CoA hydratase/isomerase family protein [Corallococcus carmarthensis]